MKKVLFAVAAVALAATGAWAYGPHDPNCVECHSLHEAQGKAILAVAPNTTEKNPATGSGATGAAALCLGCHNEDEGIIPIHLNTTHPVGMKPNKVKVPGDMLSKTGTLDCTGCHNPHPSNPNYKYLRGNVAKGSELGKFCSQCHGDKVDMGAFAKAPAKKK